MLLLRCPLDPITGKPETTLFRAIKGNDSFYLVENAVRANPTSEQLSQMAHEIGSSNVCDGRSKDHPCPDLKQQGFQKQ
jgi:hypothetical protein